jgi:hypothetical protein
LTIWVFGLKVKAPPKLDGKERNPMPVRSMCVTILAIAWITMNAGTSQGADFPDITGVWAGTYNAAFPKGHGWFAEEKKGIQMELHVVKQDENLIWAENRWKVNELDEWHSEYATGTFNLHDPTTLTIVEKAPNPDYGSTGIFEGKLDGEKMYLTYKDIGGGISFSTVLERK